MPSRRGGGSSRSGGGRKGGGGKNYRSAKSGRYVKKSTADRNPGGTVGEKRGK